MFHEGKELWQMPNERISKCPAKAIAAAAVAAAAAIAQQFRADY